MDENKFERHQIVKMVNKPGLFVVIGLMPGESGYVYTLIPKAKYDEAKEMDTYPEDTIYFEDVDENNISLIF